jgi:RNA polymerase sigma-70 factor (ECF subfamily)
VRRDLAQRLQNEVAELPRMQRDVFLLRAQQGLEYEEIATTLGTTVGAARVHYHHAVRRLKKVAER